MEPFPKPIYLNLELHIAKYMTDWDLENSGDYEVKILHHRRQGCSTQKEPPRCANNQTQTWQTFDHVRKSYIVSEAH